MFRLRNHRFSDYHCPHGQKIEIAQRMGRLTTHVLDTGLGRPGAGIPVAVFRLEGTGDDVTRRRLQSVITNQNGRCDEPLLEGESLKPGIYELVFSLSEYFSASGQVLPTPPFVGDVILRVGIADTSQHYHVPLLVSPWSYSTYRGS